MSQWRQELFTRQAGRLDHKWSKQLIMNAGTTGTGYTARKGRPPSPRCRLKPQLKSTVPDDQAPTWRLLPPPETSRVFTDLCGSSDRISSLLSRDQERPETRSVAELALACRKSEYILAPLRLTDCAEVQLAVNASDLEALLLLNCCRRLWGPVASAGAPWVFRLRWLVKRNYASRP